MEQKDSYLLRKQHTSSEIRSAVSWCASSACTRSVGAYGQGVIVSRRCCENCWRQIRCVVHGWLERWKMREEKEREKMRRKSVCYLGIVWKEISPKVPYQVFCWQLRQQASRELLMGALDLFLAASFSYVFLQVRVSRALLCPSSLRSVLSSLSL